VADVLEHLLVSRSLLDGVAAATSIRDREDLDCAIADLLLQFLGARSVSIFRLFDEDPVKRLVRRVELVADAGGRSLTAAEETTTVRSLSCPSVWQAPAWQVCSARNHSAQCIDPDDQWITLFPICGEREVSGILAIESAASLLTRETKLVHGILRIAQNHLALLDYGELDTLTGLFNRKTFESKFEKLRQRLSCADEAAARESSWLALMDIDRFKAINDSYGHLFGDEVLLLISQEIKRCCRGADQLFRFGGEEFLVVLDQASDAGALIALERLRGAIETRRFPQVGRITVSLGYTRIDRGDIASRCVERADAALYYAKAHGRNNVQSFESLCAAGELNHECASGDVELF
jgi:diguanylate cyclase (GGDEF)-like protein